jgi:hypothetical protein
MKHNMRLLLIGMCLLLSLMGGPSPAHAYKSVIMDDPTQIYPTITVIHMVANEKTYKEDFRWSFAITVPWTIFYNNIPSFPASNTKTDPFTVPTSEFFIVTVNNRNMIEGDDIYISQEGIMMLSRRTSDIFYFDENNFSTFLGKEQLAKAGYEKLSLPDDRGKDGIVVLYNISEQIANPSWLISSPEELDRYHAYLSLLTPLEKFHQVEEMKDPKYNRLGNYVLYLNYPKAPARVATVSGQYVRMSSLYMTNNYYQDPKNYFAYYKTQMEKIRNEEVERLQNRKKDSQRKAF